MNNFLTFGTYKKKSKKEYETLYGNLYDEYLLIRYFKDIYNIKCALDNKKKLKSLHQKLHDKKDLKFNLINYILILITKKSIFYEFGSTIFEKIYYFKLFDNILNKKVSNKIKYFGTEVSQKLNFFSINFHQNYKVKILENLNKNIFKSANFYAKGVTLLYEKKNYALLKNIFSYFECGHFDFSIVNKRKIYKINTGKKLHFITKNKFLELLKNSKKEFLIRNIKKSKNKMYFEIIFGNKKIINNFLFYYNKIKKNQKFKHYGVNKNFKIISLKKDFLF